MKSRCCLLSVIALVVSAGTARAQCSTTKVAAEAPAADNWFGTSVALSGGTMVVGNPYSDVGNHDEQGTLRVFSNIFGWSAQATLSRTGGSAGEWLGRSVDVSGDWIIAGMPLYEEGSGGAVFFKRSGGQWNQASSLVLLSFQPSAHAGITVAIDGDYAIIGVPDADSVDTDVGWAQLAVRVGDAWQYGGSFITSALLPFDHAGSSVGVRGNLFMMGVPGRSVSGHPGAGVIAIGTPGLTTFTESQLMNASDPQDGAALGRAAAMDDGIIVAGAPDYDNGIALDSGAVYIFEPGQLGIWVQTARILPPSPTPSAHFGGHVAVDGNRVVISEFGTGKTYIYRKTNLGGWVEEWRLHDPESLGQGFGGGVAVSGDKVAVSSTLGEINGINAAGYVNVFDVAGAFGANAKSFAAAVTAGAYSGCTEFATDDGSTTCGSSNSSPDVWFRFTAPCTGNVTFNTFGSSFDTVLSVHSSSLAGPGPTIVCNDNAGQFFETSSVTTALGSGQEVYIRIAGNNSAHGNYTLNIQACGPASCYANCDASTGAPLLTANDFQCFLNAFAAGCT